VKILRNIGGALVGLLLWIELVHAATPLTGQIIDLGAESTWGKVVPLGLISLLAGGLTRLIAHGIPAIHLLAFVLCIPLGLAAIRLPFNRDSPRNLPVAYLLVTLAGFYLSAGLWALFIRLRRR
jgi:hypothetical protein